jgi:type IV pilus assembly protein PilZ
VLYAAYMPFVRRGGLFVPKNKKYDLGEEVFITLALMDEPEKIPINGNVVWVTPKGAQGNRQAEIGVQFSEADFTAATKIEEHFGTGLVSDRPTHTI